MANKIYTRTGDDGSTSLWSGKRVKKNHPRLVAYGTIDELNSTIGLIVSEIDPASFVYKDLTFAQRLLFLLGSYLSCDKTSLAKSLPDFQDKWILYFEQSIDNMNEKLPELKNFILPGGNRAASYCHLARCICRRAERFAISLEEEIAHKDMALKLLNRLSDYFFVLSRYLNNESQVNEQIWLASDLLKE